MRTWLCMCMFQRPWVTARQAWRTRHQRLYTHFLESAGQQDFKNRLSSIVSMTADMVAEHAIGHFVDKHELYLLPSWMRAGVVASDVQDDETSEDADAPPKKLLPNSMVVPGAMHMVHNLSKDIDSKLSWWKEFHSGLGAWKACWGTTRGDNASSQPVWLALPQLHKRSSSQSSTRSSTTSAGKHVRSSCSSACHSSRFCVRPGSACDVARCQVQDIRQ